MSTNLHPDYRWHNVTRRLVGDGSIAAAWLRSFVESWTPPDGGRIYAAGIQAPEFDLDVVVETQDGRRYGIHTWVTREFACQTPHGAMKLWLHHQLATLAESAPRNAA